MSPLGEKHRAVTAPFWLGGASEKTGDTCELGLALGIYCKEQYTQSRVVLIYFNIGTFIWQGGPDLQNEKKSKQVSLI